MTYKNRIKTLRLLAGGSPDLSASSQLSAIYGEFNSIGRSRSRNSSDGLLLAVLHTTRGLDTCLSEILLNRGWSVAGKNLNAYLKELQAKRVIYSNELRLYQTSLVHKRNKYMHEAGATPNKNDADRLLTIMHDILFDVIARLP